MKYLKLNKFIYCLMLFLISGCNNSQKENKCGGTLTFGSPVAPTIINPILTTDSISAHLVPLIFNGLFKADKEGNILPDLAQSYEIKRGGREYWIKLKKGVKFQDGAALTGADVKFTYEKIKNTEKANFSDAFEKINKIELIDKYNIKLYLNEPFAPLLYALTIGILPEHIYRKKTKEDYLNWHPVGSGPFKLTSLTSKKIVLSRHDDYFSGKPCLDKITCDIDKSANLWAKLIRGEISYTKSVPENLAHELKNNRSLQQYDLLDPRSYMLILNFNKPKFDDKRIRQALNFAIDKESIIKEILHGRGIPCYSPVFPQNWAYNHNLKPYEYNPHKSLELLKTSGWKMNEKDGFLYKDGKCFEFTCITLKGFPDVEASSSFIQYQLNQIGIKMNIIILPNVDEFYALLKEGDWDAFFGGLRCNTEPDQYYQKFHSTNIGGSNLFNYKNVEVDNLLELGRKTNDFNMRKSIYQKFQEIIYDDPPGIFVYYKKITIAINKNVMNASPEIDESFRDIERWWIAGAE